MKINTVDSKQEANVITGARCMDCGLSYPFPLDCTLPHDQWKQIAPDDGLLCANCMVKSVPWTTLTKFVKEYTEDESTDPLTDEQKKALGATIGLVAKIKPRKESF